MTLSIYLLTILENSLSRTFSHADDAALAIMYALEHKTCRQRYKIARDEGFSTAEILCMVSKIMGKAIKTKIVKGYKDKGCMEREEGGWKAAPLETSLTQAVQWMTQEENLHWLGL